MKFKRLISCGLIGIMAASLLAGCGSGSGDSGETATTEDGKIQIEYWYSGGKTAVDVLTNMIEEFNESQDTYEVVGTTQADYTETYEKLQAGIAGDNAPDVALIDVDKARNLSDKNLIADINPYVEADSEFDREDYLDVFYDQGLDEDGKKQRFTVNKSTYKKYRREYSINTADIMYLPHTRIIMELDMGRLSLQ